MCRGALNLCCAFSFFLINKITIVLRFLVLWFVFFELDFSFMRKFPAIWGNLEGDFGEILRGHLHKILEFWKTNLIAKNVEEL